MNANNYQNQKLRGLKRKYEIIEARGGKCEICGYNKNLAALDFHHKNPDEKEFQLDMRQLSNCSLEKLESELSKCIILCANCHRELHNKDLAMSNIPLLLEDAISKKSFNNKEKYGSICPVCGKHFPKMKGKIYCSKECRESTKNYPTKLEVELQYSNLKSWKKVADYFNLTRRIIDRIRKQ